MTNLVQTMFFEAPFVPAAWIAAVWCGTDSLGHRGKCKARKRIEGEGIALIAKSEK